VKLALAAKGVEEEEEAAVAEGVSTDWLEYQVRFHPNASIQGHLLRVGFLSEPIRS
jgi:hypothetical protein